MVQFATGTTLQTSWLSFAEYPSDAIAPRIFIPPDSACLLICSTATEYSRKVGLLWNKRNPTKWFVKIIPSAHQNEFESNEEFVSSLEGGISRTGTSQLNPARLHGNTVGPFNSYEEIREWAKIKKHLKGDGDDFSC